MHVHMPLRIKAKPYSERERGSEISGTDNIIDYFDDGIMLRTILCTLYRQIVIEP